MTNNWNRMTVPAAWFLGASLLVGSAGCSQADEATPPNAAENEASQDRASQDRGRKDRASKDRGSAAFTAGENSWTATSASVRRKADTLRISASNSSREGDMAIGERLSLVIPAYQGPGTYQAGPTSMWVRAGFDTSKDKSEQQTQQAAMAVLQGAKQIRLAGAEVEITADDGDFIEGRFATSAGSDPATAVRDGHFRAQVKAPRAAKP